MTKKYLYVITVNENLGYDVYIGAVVCATSEAEARRIHPSGEAWPNPDKWGEWVEFDQVDDKIDVTCIGVATNKSCVVGDVILSSYRHA